MSEAELKKNNYLFLQRTITNPKTTTNGITSRDNRGHQFRSPTPAFVTRISGLLSFTVRSESFIPEEFDRTVGGRVVTWGGVGRGVVVGGGLMNTGFPQSNLENFLQTLKNSSHCTLED